MSAQKQFGKYGMYRHRLYRDSQSDNIKLREYQSHYNGKTVCVCVVCEYVYMYTHVSKELTSCRRAAATICPRQACKW